MNSVVSDNSRILKFDNFSDFQKLKNIISNNSRATLWHTAYEIDMWLSPLKVFKIFPTIIYFNRSLFPNHLFLMFFINYDLTLLVISFVAL